MKSGILKHVLCTGLAVLLAFTPTLLPIAAAPETMASADIKTKDEVIYAVLHPDGSVDNIYAVNHFTVDKAGTITDYGDYTSVENLTNTAALTHNDDAVTFTADTDNFYYQGNMAAGELPWLFDITYSLDGAVLPAREIAGKSGSFGIGVKTKQNESKDPAFYNNYMLQITVTLDTEKCGDIQAPDAAIAAAGKNRAVVFTVLPGTDADLSLTANVKDFTMTGIDITAVPFSMNIELPDTGGMTDGLIALSGAISDLNDGVTELNNGAAELKSGAQSAVNGSTEIKNGLTRLSGSSAPLIRSSSQISGAITQITSSLGSASAGDLSELPPALTQFAGGLKEISGGLTNLKGGFTQAYGALDAAVQSIPAEAVSEDEIKALYAQTDINSHGTIDRLVASYAAAQTVLGTYNQVKGAFDAVGPAIDELTASLNTITPALEEMAKQTSGALGGMEMIGQLSAGLTELKNNYAAFHNGLKAFADGVGAASAGYAEFHNGLSSLNAGVAVLSGGVSELSDGTARLNDETADMPDAIEKEIDKMLDQYTGSDFGALSFTSPKNKDTGMVQFVIKCAGIDKPKETVTARPETPDETFWDRLTALFRYRPE